MITVLCVMKNSIYKGMPGMDPWDEERDAFRYHGSNPIIAHAPCQQWSRMKAFAKDDKDEKELAYFCLKWVIRNGGVFEHPHGSSFFKEVGIKPTICVDQSWFGFPARKRTWLYFHKCKPISHPLNFEYPKQKVALMSYLERSRTVEKFAVWLANSISLS